MIRGLPGTLPADERVLWQGAPCWRSLALRLCHLRGVALYVGVVAAGLAAFGMLEGEEAAEIAAAVLPMLIGGLLVLAFLAGLAWLVARTTEYTLTTHRLVIRFGVALPATLAIPHRGIARAAVALHADGTGDLPVETKPGYTVAWRRIWPHSRPFRLGRAVPMLRSVPQAAQLATLLAATLAEARRRMQVAESVDPSAPARYARRL